MHCPNQAIAFNQELLLYSSEVLGPQLGICIFKLYDMWLIVARINGLSFGGTVQYNKREVA